jgi:hypothetical protein
MPSHGIIASRDWALAPEITEETQDIAEFLSVYLPNNLGERAQAPVSGVSFAPKH